MYSGDTPTQLPRLFNLSVRPKSTGASPSFHPTATKRSSSQSTVLSTDTEQPVAFMVYFPEHKAIISLKSLFEKWEGKRSPYSCAQN